MHIILFTPHVNFLSQEIIPLYMRKLIEHQILNLELEINDHSFFLQV